MKRWELLLTQLQEEAGEVIQASSKCLRFGAKEIYPETGIKNRERLAQEIDDFLALVEMLISDSVFRTSNPIAIARKRLKVEKLLIYSKECGQLNEGGLR